MEDGHEARMRVELAAKDRATDAAFDAWLSVRQQDGSIPAAPPKHHVGLGREAALAKLRECQQHASVQIVGQGVGGPLGLPTRISCSSNSMKQGLSSAGRAGRAARGAEA